MAYGQQVARGAGGMSVSDRNGRNSDLDRYGRRSDVREWIHDAGPEAVATILGALDGTRPDRQTSHS